MTVRILQGDCREVLKTLPDNSVHCCVTSPPYWGLRSYLPDGHPNKLLEIGSEPTLQEWVDTMVSVFREVRRVLRPDGTLWLNLGDAYAGSRQGPQGMNSSLVGNGHQGGGAKRLAVPRQMTKSARRDDEPIPRSDVAVTGLKAKDMMGQPWRVAFALQADGWWLRQEIIWHKPNPMPESTRDRCTKAHEHVFLLSKSERYFYAVDAMQEPATSSSAGERLLTPAGWATGDAPHHAASHQTAKHHRKTRNNGVGFGHGFDKNPKPRVVSGQNDGGYAEGKSERLGRGPGWREAGGGKETRNPRSVWSIPTYPFKGAHFATFPPALAERCITAGCPVGDVVLDPFGGSGTVGLVADRQHKDAILIDLDERNVPMATERIAGEAPLFSEVAA